MSAEGLWLDALQSVIGRAAHEVKDSLNGVSLNLEVIRSRVVRRGGAGENGTLSAFSTAAVEQLELLSLRTEAVLFLTRPSRGQVDVAVVLKHLATLLIPAIRADGGRLTVDGYQTSAPTSAPAMPTRLGLASALLALADKGGSAHVRLETSGGTVVRFSHESASPCSLDPAVASVLAEHSIRLERSGRDLLMTFPA